MFKIVENGDGSTSVFCKESGRLICRVNNRKPSAVAVGRPIVLRQEVRTRSQTIKRRCPSLPKEDSPLEKKLRIEAWADSVGNSDKNSFVSSADSLSSEDPSDDCVDQHSFLKAFDLVDTCELRLKGAIELRYSFPRRGISRSGPPVPPGGTVPRPYDDMELCSPLGMRLCPLRNQLGPSQQELAVKKYDKYCKVSALSQAPLSHPALRNRESLKYGVTFRTSKEGGRRQNGAHTHLYSFSMQQRRERYLQLVTGLNRRSRFLRWQVCQPFEVHLYRITERKIQDWTRPSNKQKSEDGSSDEDCVVIGEVIRTVRPINGASQSFGSSLTGRTY